MKQSGGAGAAPSTPQPVKKCGHWHWLHVVGGVALAVASTALSLHVLPVAGPIGLGVGLGYAVAHAIMAKVDARQTAK
jgi:hypothetical protein